MNRNIVLPARSGLVIVGTLTGSKLLVEEFNAGPGEPVAPALAEAIEAVYSALPSIIDEHKGSRFDFLVRGTGDDGPVDWYYNSGLRTPDLFYTVARKLAKVRTAAAAVQLQLRPASVGVSVSEVQYRPADFGPIEYDFSTAGRA